MGAVRAAFRWQRLLESLPRGKGLGMLLQVVPPEAREALALVRSLCDGEAAEGGSSAEGAEDKDEAVALLALAVVENHRLAASRQGGLVAFRVLVTTLKTPSLAVDVLAALTPSLRAANVPPGALSSLPAAAAPSPGDESIPATRAVGGHYLSGLSAIGQGPSEALGGAFAALLGDLLADLEGTELANDQAAAAAQQVVDVRRLLLICDCLGLAFTDADWPVLARRHNVLASVHGLAKKLNRAIQQTTATATGTSAAERAAASSLASSGGNGLFPAEHRAARRRGAGTLGAGGAAAGTRS